MRPLTGRAGPLSRLKSKEPLAEAATPQIEFSIARDALDCQRPTTFAEVDRAVSEDRGVLFGGPLIGVQRGTPFLGESQNTVA